VRKWTRALMLLATVLLAVLALAGLPQTATAASGQAQTPGTAANVSVTTTGDTGGESVELILFWGDGCPHCAAEHEWLEEAKEKYPNLVVTEYEVWFDEGNRELLAKTAEEMGFEPSGVPVTIIGGRHWIGFSDSVRAQLELTIAEAATGAMITEQGQSSSSTVDVPLVGEVAVSSDSLAFSSLVIGFVDGVNPCSLWVISVLLAIVVRTGSRRRVFAIGTTFLLVTAAMYAVYMVGIFSAMSVMGHLGSIQLVVALVAGIFGIVSVKDYFAFKKGVSFTIKDSAKPGIYRRMRAAAGQEHLLPALGATVILAVGVSLLETPCTAGFPVLWSGLLAANGVGTAEAVGLFGLYMLPFLLDELIVFTLAVVTLRAAKMQERHGRLLKLVAGTTMLALAGTVLVSPATMNEPVGALAVFAAAFAVAAVVHLLTTWVTQRRQGDGRPSSHQPSRPVSHGSTK
jgi:thiol-disulfide isomerase/thioredoxin